MGFGGVLCFPFPPWTSLVINLQIKKFTLPHAKIFTLRITRDSALGITKNKCTDTSQELVACGNSINLNHHLYYDILKYSSSLYPLQTDQFPFGTISSYFSTTNIQDINNLGSLKQLKFVTDPDIEYENLEKERDAKTKEKQCFYY